MIEVVYHKRFFRVSIKGHARSGEEGKDLVCAAVSALCYTLARSVSELEMQKAAFDVNIRLDGGDAEIACRPASRMKAAAGIVYATVAGGLALLADQYPEYIRYREA